MFINTARTESSENSIVRNKVTPANIGAGSRPGLHALELTGCDQPIELGEAFRREQIERRLRGRRVCALGELAAKIIVLDYELEHEIVGVARSPEIAELPIE
jgi:hypothetical protein